MTDYNETLRGLALERYTQIRNQNRSFSKRAFAKKLGFHPATLSLFMNGGRNLSRPMALKLAFTLGLDEEQVSRIQQELENSHFQVVQKKFSPSRYQLLPLDQYELVADSLYYSILNLLETKDFQTDPSWISRRLKTTSNRVKGALKRLDRLGVLKKSHDEKLVRQCSPFTTTDSVRNDSLIQRHRNNLEDAIQALEEVPIEERDFSFATMAIDPTRIPQARQMIRDFRETLMNFLEEGEKTEVYEVCIQLFPRSRSLPLGSKNSSR